MWKSLKRQLFTPMTLHFDRLQAVILPFCAKHFQVIKDSDAWFDAIERQERGELPERPRIAALLLDYL